MLQLFFLGNVNDIKNRHSFISFLQSRIFVDGKIYGTSLFRTRGNITYTRISLQNQGNAHSSGPKIAKK